MHRFLWSLAWASSGGPTLRAALADAQSEIAKILSNKEDLKLGRQIFVEAIEARRALAEIASVQKQLADVQEKVRQTPSIRALPMGCPTSHTSVLQPRIAIRYSGASGNS